MLRGSNLFALTCSPCACVRMWSICRYNVGVNNRNKNDNKVGKWYERIRYLFIHSGIRIPPLPSTSRNPNPITLKCSMPEPDIIVPPLSVEKESFFFGRRARRSATRFTKKKPFKCDIIWIGSLKYKTLCMFFISIVNSSRESAISHIH